MIRIHYAIDQDDVMLDFLPNVLECFYREYGIRVPFDGSPWGQRAKDFAKHPALLASGYNSWWGWLRDRDWLWGIAPAVPGAVGGVKTLRARGHYTEMVTSKPEWAEPQVWRWLGKWKPPFEQVTITKPGISKVDATDADIIIDDKRETCEQFVAAGRMAIHFDQSRQAKPSDCLFVAYDWTEVLLIDDALGKEIV